MSIVIGCACDSVLGKVRVISLKLSGVGLSHFSVDVWDIQVTHIVTASAGRSQSFHVIPSRAGYSYLVSSILWHEAVIPINGPSS